VADAGSSPLLALYYLESVFKMLNKTLLIFVNQLAEANKPYVLKVQRHDIRMG
jgi:hypothetical protein